MKSKLQIDAQQLTSDVTEEVLKAIKPLLTPKEGGEKMQNLQTEHEQSASLPALPQYGFLRLWQILGDRSRGVPPIIPVSKSTWWTGVKSGRYPKPVKLSARCSCWRVEDIRSLISRTK